MHRFTAIVLFFIFLTFDVEANFSSSSIELHPRFPGDSPFILEISGTWPTDCHPGEQNPVVVSFDGLAVEVEFEIVVIHVTCNDIDTPYRTLVDLSEVLRSTPATGDTLDIKVDFQGAQMQQVVDLVCSQGEGCAPDEAQKPQPGLYDAAGLSRQGLLLARQARAAGLFPLVYDESGRAEWLFGGSPISGDAYFSHLRRPSGGDCLGCEPTGVEPELKPVGYITILFDSPGVMQVKINDGLFTEYRSLVFGYRIFGVGPGGNHEFIDIEGRWGISENRGTNPPLGDITEFLPGAFDIVLESYTLPGATTPGQLAYLVTTLTGEPLGQLFCGGQTGPGGDNACEFIDPTDAAEPLFNFYQQGTASLVMEYGRIYVDVGDAPGGRAVRLD